jgi:hypothetical protein
VPAARFVAEGRVGEETACVEEADREGDGAARGTRPGFFFSSGRKGPEYYFYCRGRGGGGLERVGRIQQAIRPQISQDPEDPSQSFIPSVLMMGRVVVLRAYTGVRPGKQGYDRRGSRWFITPEAAARIDQHEEKHIDESRRIHDATILPMEMRIAECVRRPRSGLEEYIAWDATLEQFREQDDERNGMGGTLDTEELAAGDIPQLHPRVVLLDGIEYHDYLKMPWEEAPGERR